jgi:hypothetical protein
MWLAVAEGAAAALGTSVVLRRVTEVAADDLLSSKGGQPSSEVREFNRVIVNVGQN